MDRSHTAAMLQAMSAAHVQIYENCNVFNDKAFLVAHGLWKRARREPHLSRGRKTARVRLQTEHGIMGP